MIKVGTCGFSRSKEAIFKELNAVEVQQTFYKPPQVDTARKWRNGAEKHFEFMVKAWQLITHEPSSPTYKKAGVKIEQGKEDRYGFFRPTKEVFDAWETTKQVSKALRAKIVVFQCPTSFTPCKENLDSMYQFFRSIERDFYMAWEPRGEWSTETIEKACSDLELIHCVDPFASRAVTKGLAYFRLHGRPPGKRMYYYSYTDEDLENLSTFCNDFSGAYVMFNNMTMFEDALRFKGMASAIQQTSSRHYQE